jgi:hypothetical protein
VSGATLWFPTKSNHVLHHALNPDTGGARCNQTVRPRTAGTGHSRDELSDQAVTCSRCHTKVKADVAPLQAEDLAPDPAPEKPKRLTATQMWATLTLLQREQILAWFVTTYAPSRNVARFQLTKNPSLTHAESIIAEQWEGME